MQLAGLDLRDNFNRVSLVAIGDFCVLLQSYEHKYDVRAYLCPANCFEAPLLESL